MKQPRKLGNYGTSAFKAPSRSQLDALDKKRKATTFSSEDETSLSSAAENNTTNNNNNNRILYSNPKLSSGDVIAARMKSSKPRLAATAEGQQASSSSLAFLDDPKEECTISGRLKRQSIPAPIYRKNTSSVTPTRSRTPPPSSSTTPATKLINTVDFFESTTIGYRAKKLAETKKMDPVFQSTAPRFRSLRQQQQQQQETEKTSSSDFSSSSATAFQPKGIAERANEKSLVRMSLSKTPRFVEKHSLTERAELYTPRGFAEEVLLKNQYGASSSSVSRSRRRARTPPVSRSNTNQNNNSNNVDYDTNGELIRPRFKTPERLTSNCEMFVPKDGIADRVMKNSDLSRNTAPFSKQTKVKELRRAIDEESTAASKKVSPDFVPKSFVEVSLEKKNTAGFAFRSTTPRFVSRSSSRKDSGGAHNNSSAGQQQRDHKNDEPMMLTRREREKLTKPSPNFASKIGRFGQTSRATSNFVEEGGHTFVPTSFVDKILRK